MGRIFGILLMVGLIWVGLEFYTKGSAGAFGGIFEGWDDPVAQYPESTDGRSITQRVGEQVSGDINASMDRVERGIER